MNNIVGTKTRLTWAIHISLAILVIAWLIPTVGLFVSSFRTVDQISGSGWWNSLTASADNLTLRTAAPDTQVEENGQFIIRGNLFEEKQEVSIIRWGINSRDISAYGVGESAELRNGGSIVLNEDGRYVMQNSVPFTGSRGTREFVTAEVPPEFTLENYKNILVGSNTSSDMSKAFISTLTVAIPATIIPILIAAFAAYALAWMQLPGRIFLIVIIVGLYVVPLQVTFIPILKLHNNIGIGKGFIGVWLAHTGFGMPLAVYLLRNYMVGLPRDIIENARVDGASDFQIFRKIILPLSFPALASLSIFQFLWTWNDLLVAKVFLIDASGDTTVMTSRIVELMGSWGGNWEILSTAAFVSIVVPLIVFFAMQKYLVRGLLSGSVK